jgi:predicted P-loop ATPase
MLIDGLDGQPTRHLGDAELVRLFLLIDKRYDFRPGMNFFTQVISQTARRNSFHPVRDHLDGLQWDGTSRIDTWLCTYAGAADTPYVRAVGRLLLIAAVRRVRRPGCKFDEMLVLESVQGLNKSQALRLLAVRDEWFSDDLPLYAEGREVIERTRGRWIIEAAELHGMKKGEVEHLKSFLSRQIDRARLVWHHVVTEAPRQCVIVGTTNAERYLKDMTGNRRFWPVKVELFDLDRLRADRDQLWAEAAMAEAKGESIRLAKELYADAAAEQAERVQDDAWYPVLADAFGEHEGKVAAENVWIMLGMGSDKIGHRTQDHNDRLGIVMRALGFKRKKLRVRNTSLDDDDIKGTAPRWCYARGDEQQELFPYPWGDGWRVMTDEEMEIKERERQATGDGWDTGADHEEDGQDEEDTDP